MNQVAIGNLFGPKVAQISSKKRALSPSPRSESSILWSDSHTPVSGTDIEKCMYAGTVDKVRKWLVAASRPRPLKKLLILSGKPG